jgi:hypothetical protein
MTNYVRPFTNSGSSPYPKYDPAEPRIHLAPIRVAPETKRRGVGRRLMERYCKYGS